MLAGVPALSLPALSACAHFPRLPGGGPGDPIEAVPVYREAASAARVMAQAEPVSLERWRRRGAGQRLFEVLTWPMLDLL